MTTSRKRWRLDREALAYLQALEAGDLQAVAETWERASSDPELEALLVELDQGLASERGDPAHGKLEPRDSGRRQPSREVGTIPTRQWRRRVGIACALAAAGILAVLAWRGVSGNRPLKEESHPPLELANTASNEEAFAALPIVVRSNARGALTHFTWPVEERSPIRVGSSIPPDLLN